MRYDMQTQTIRSMFDETVPPMLADGGVHLTVTASDDATIVLAELDGRTAAGTAKRAPGERRQPAAAARLAAARALHNLAAMLEADADLGSWSDCPDVQTSRAADSSRQDLPDLGFTVAASSLGFDQAAMRRMFDLYDQPDSRPAGVLDLPIGRLARIINRALGR